MSKVKKKKKNRRRFAYVWKFEVNFETVLHGLLFQLQRLWQIRFVLHGSHNNLVQKVENNPLFVVVKKKKGGEKKKRARRQNTKERRRKRG